MEWIPAKTILSRVDGRHWFGYDYNMNIYRGCCHGCLYCDSRSDCYHIEDFDRVRAKQDVLRILRNELRKKRKTGIIGTGAMSDPYNPLERKYQLTRQALEQIHTGRFGVGIATKSNLIARDIDLLSEIGTHSPVLCKFTVTAADDRLAQTVEPHAPLSSERFDAISRLSSAGIFTGILMMPLLPFLEDHEENVAGIVRFASESGARFIFPSFGVTLRQGQREYFYSKLEQAYPDQGLAARYKEQYGGQYSCQSPHAARLWKVFSKACDQAGILYRMPDIIEAYRHGYGDSQLSFF